MTGRVDFICIGAQKAATSWLWEQLRRHPQIWMPPRKELHYFDRSTDYPSPSHLASSSVARRLFGRERQNRAFRTDLMREMREAIAARDWKWLRWTLRYHLRTFDDASYLALFEGGHGKICGEVTPSYSILDASDVRRVHDLLPDLRVIYLLRDPIERAWSHLRLGWELGSIKDPFDVDEVKRFVDSPMQSLRGDYARTLGIWRSTLARDRLFIGFYDDVEARPQWLMREVLGFLGADPTLLPASETLATRVKVSPTAAMPVEVRRYLAQKYQPELVRLRSLVDSEHVLRWLERAERALACEDSAIRPTGAASP